MFIWFFIYRGFYPKGRGEVHLTVNPIGDHLKPVKINDFGDHPAIKGVILISGPKHQANKYQVQNFNNNDFIIIYIKVSLQNLDD